MQFLNKGYRSIKIVQTLIFYVIISTFDMFELVESRQPEERHNLNSLILHRFGRNSKLKETIAKST